MFEPRGPSPCTLLDDETLFGMPIWVKRDDLLHPVVSGNKYRKLKTPLSALAESVKHANLSSARSPKIITMGGIWSNHLHATAYAAAEMRFDSHAFVRGHAPMNTVMLDDCRKQGMQIQYVDREVYRALRDDPGHWQTLVAQEPHCYWLPEGGSTPDALAGVAELVDELPFIPDVILVACGTGATMAGLLAGLRGRGRVVGIAVINHGEYLRNEMSRLLCQAGYVDYRNYQLHTHFHHGGYAKASPELHKFCGNFMERFQLPIEPVYTGKVFFALQSLIASGDILRHEKVVVLHTGGLQGARSGL